MTPGPRGLIVLACIAALFGLTRASAQHQHPPADVPLHEQFYSTWMMPDNPSISCCHNRDCYPTEARHDEQGWLAKRREDGKWLRVPAPKVEQNRDNPDGRNHLCAPTPETAALVEVFCFTVGSGM